MAPLSASSLGVPQGTLSLPARQDGVEPGSFRQHRWMGFLQCNKVGNAASAALPVRLALGQEGVESFAEIGARVDHADDIVIIDFGVAVAQSTQQFFSRTQR